MNKKITFPNLIECIKQCESLTGNDIIYKKPEKHVKLLMDECNCVSC